MELIIALVLFVGLILTWLVLPGSTSASATPELAITTATVSSTTAAQAS